MEANKPDLTKIRRIVFWDTSFEKIDWDKHKKFVVIRVFERGTEEEKKEIIRFYGREVVDDILSKKPPDWRIASEERLKKGRKK